MGRGTDDWDEAKVKRRLAAGYGQGVGASYKPWLNKRDFPSIGRVSSPKGWKTGRKHELFSDNETHYFYLLEWLDSVTDIREQFPLLPPEETLEIADELGIKHPVYKKSRYPEVMTSDFNITVSQDGRTKYVIRTVKPSIELNKPRVLDKFEIERVYWSRRNADWGIVTEKEIPLALAENIEWCHDAVWLEKINGIDKKNISRILDIIKRQLVSNEGSLIDLLNNIDSDYNLKSGVALSLFRHLVATKQVYIDMQKKIEIINMPVKDVRVLDYQSIGGQYA